MCRCIRRACTVGHEDAWSGSISTINNKQILCSTSQCVSRARKTMADGLWNAASHICQHLILRDMRRLVTHPQCISIIYFMKRNRYQHEIAKTCYQPLNSLLPGHCINGRPGMSYDSIRLATRALVPRVVGMDSYPEYALDASTEYIRVDVAF